MFSNISTISKEQWAKVVRALYYSFSSGFAGGFILSLTGAISGIVNGTTPSIGKSAVVALILGGVVGGLNSLAVAIKQLYTIPSV